jgi:hypothetical protein
MGGLIDIIQFVVLLVNQWEAYKRNPRQTCLSWVIALVLFMVIFGIILATWK